MRTRTFDGAGHHVGPSGEHAEAVAASGEEVVDRDLVGLVGEHGLPADLDGSVDDPAAGGEAPMRSPATTVIVFFPFCWSASAASWVARCSAPPASTVTGAPVGVTPVWMRPPEPAGASRLPWKSLRARSWT